LKFLGGESTQKVFGERGSGNEKWIGKFKIQNLRFKTAGEWLALFVSPGIRSCVRPWK